MLFCAHIYFVCEQNTYSWFRKPCPNQEVATQKKKKIRKIRLPHTASETTALAMVFHHISPDMKLHALALLQSGWEMPNIVEALDVSKQSIVRWDDNFDKYGHANPWSVLQG